MSNGLTGTMFLLVRILELCALVLQAFFVFLLFEIFKNNIFNQRCLHIQPKLESGKSKKYTILNPAPMLFHSRDFQT